MFRSLLKGLEALGGELREQRVDSRAQVRKAVIAWLKLDADDHYRKAKAQTREMLYWAGVDL